jgi:hypothetical protein
MTDRCEEASAGSMRQLASGQVSAVLGDRKDENLQLPAVGSVRRQHHRVEVDARVEQLGRRTSRCEVSAI